MPSILYHLRYFPTLTETFVAGEIGAVAARGVRVAVAATGSRSDGALAECVPGVPIHRIPRRPLAGRLSRDTAGMRWLRSHQRPKDVARLPWLAHRARDFERVHVHFAGEAAEMARALHMDLGIPYSVMVHAHDLFVPRPALDEVLADATAVLVETEHQRGILEGRGHRATVLRCGPDLRQWLPAHLPEGPLRVFVAARSVPKKGLDVLFEAWRRLDRPGVLRVATSSPGPAPSGVEWLGLLPPARVREELRAANLACLPCRRAPDGDMDGLPLFLMEALATGRPVVTTDIGGLPELFDETTGWIVPADDPDRLVQALRDAADQPTERARRGANGPSRLRERRCTLDDQAAGAMAAWGISPSAPSGG